MYAGEPGALTPLFRIYRDGLGVPTDQSLRLSSHPKRLKLLTSGYTCCECVPQTALVRLYTGSVGHELIGPCDDLTRMKEYHENLSEGARCRSVYLAGYWQCLGPGSFQRVRRRTSAILSSGCESLAAICSASWLLPRAGRLCRTCMARTSGVA